MAKPINEMVQDYLRHLAREWVKSGKTQRSLATKAHVSTAVVSDFINEKSGIGWERAQSFGAAFGLGWDELQQKAREHASAAPTAPSEPKLDKHALGRAPGWREAVVLAKQYYPDIPPEFFDQAATWLIPGGVTVEVDAPFVAGVARELRDLNRRRHVGRSGPIEVYREKGSPSKTKG